MCHIPADIDGELFSIREKIFFEARSKERLDARENAFS